MSMKDLLLSFKGRIGRKTYWIWNIFYYIAITGFASGISVLFPTYSYILLPIFLLLLVIPDLQSRLSAGTTVTSRTTGYC